MSRDLQMLLIESRKSPNDRTIQLVAADLVQELDLPGVDIWAKSILCAVDYLARGFGEFAPHWWAPPDCAHWPDVVRSVLAPHSMKCLFFSPVESRIGMRVYVRGQNLNTLVKLAKGMSELQKTAIVEVCVGVAPNNTDAYDSVAKELLSCIDCGQEPKLGKEWLDPGWIWRLKRNEQRVSWYFGFLPKPLIGTVDFENSESWEFLESSTIKAVKFSPDLHQRNDVDTEYFERSRSVAQNLPRAKSFNGLVHLALPRLQMEDLKQILMASADSELKYLYLDTLLSPGDLDALFGKKSLGKVFPQLEFLVWRSGYSRHDFSSYVKELQAARPNLRIVHEHVRDDYFEDFISHYVGLLG